MISIFSRLQKSLLPRNYSPLAENFRAGIISSRVRVTAIIFAILTPSWILVDALFYTWPLWITLAVLHIATTIGFVLIAFWSKKTENISSARGMLLALMMVPMAFFMVSNPAISHFKVEGMAQVVSVGYIFLPFIMMAGLGIFPITAVEGFALAFPVVLLTALLPLQMDTVSLLPFNSHFGVLWLLVLIAVVSTFAGMSQLQFLCQMVKQSSLDPLTHTYNRRAGTTLMDMHFAHAKTSSTPLSVAFIDLDNFKEINDVYGHEEGDNSLLNAADKIRSIMRATDIVVRWGGEEFVVIMPNTEHENAVIPMKRLLEKGLGERPDESILTASMGIAERKLDKTDDLRELINLADKRMYMAKQQGRDRMVTEGSTEVVVDSERFQ